MRKFSQAVLWTTLLFFFVAAAAIGAGSLSVGQKAPVFSVPDANGKTFDLASHRGKRSMILVFYRGYF